MRILSIFLVFYALVACNPGSESESNSLQKKVRIPGEFEAHEAIWLGFRTLETYRAPDSILEMIKEIHPYVKLNLIVEQDSLAPNLKSELSAMGIDTSNISVVLQSSTDIWYPRIA